MFLGMDTLRQGRWIVGRQDRHGRLDDHRPAIEFIGDEVNAGTVLANTCLKCPLVGVEARECRQQRWVDVQHPSLIVVDKLLAENAHITGQYHQRRVVAVD